MPLGRSLIALFVLSAPLAADELSTLDGKNVSGTLSVINETTVTMKTPTGPVDTSLAKVLALSIREAKAIDPEVKYTDVRLLDDSVLHCKTLTFQGAAKVELTLLSGVKLEVPTTYLVAFMRDAQDPALARKFAGLMGERMKRDRVLILRNGIINQLKGTLGEVDEKGLRIPFKSDLGQIDMSLEKLQGIIFFRGEAVAETPICRVYDTEGNSLTALKLGYDGKDLMVTTTLGTKLSLPAGTLSRFDFNMGKLTYLSDLEPAKVVETSGIGLVNHYRKDTNLDEEPISLDGKQYAKGLSMHAHTELEYKLAGRYKDFKAILGVDPRTGADSEPRVEIFCDDIRVFSQKVTTKNVQAVAINVTNVKTLKIVVNSRNELDLHDHVTLAEARVSQ